MFCKLFPLQRVLDGKNNDKIFETCYGMFLSKSLKAFMEVYVPLYTFTGIILQEVVRFTFFFYFPIPAYCALARPWEGLVIGAIGGLITCLSVPLIEKLKIDDPVGVIPVHFIAAIWGMLSVGLFGEVDQLESFLKLNGELITSKHPYLFSTLPIFCLK